MFTGIVTATGIVSGVERDGDQVAIRIQAPYDDLVVGESIAVDGACLTVVAMGEGWFRVQAVATTQGRTRLGEVTDGQRVNLERALAVGDRLGGHFVQGHVDGLGVVERVQMDGDAFLLDVSVPREVADVTLPHGSIALDGVSLTVNAIPKPGTVQVALIPYTRAHTTLGHVQPGDRVHVEGDLIGKFVCQLLRDRRDCDAGGNGR